MSIFARHGFLFGFAAGAVTALAATLITASMALQTKAENAVEELASYTSTILDGQGKRRSAQDTYAGQVFVVDQLTLSAAMLYGEIRSERLRSVLHAQVAKFADSDLLDDPDIAARVDRAAQVARSCLLNESDENARAACLEKLATSNAPKALAAR